MIIDSHAHLGYDFVFDEEAKEESLLYYYKKYKVDGAIVQPFINRPYLQDTMDIHNRIYEFSKNNNVKIWGMASINPHFTPEDYEKEARRCVEELGFVAIKITPIAHAVHPSSRDGFHVFEVARGLKVPVMVHTGAGAPFSDPVSLIKALDSFQDIKVILAHGGSDAFFQQALYLAEKYENIYVEPSWLSILNLRKLINTIGVSRVMFSSDHAINVPVELTKYRTLLEDEVKLERVLSGTAMEVFNLKTTSKD
ncbi:MAG: amidohydrolase family protein [Mobilitalea sp.]